MIYKKQINTHRATS